MRDYPSWIIGTTLIACGPGLKALGLLFQAREGL